MQYNVKIDRSPKSIPEMDSEVIFKLFDMRDETLLLSLKKTYSNRQSAGPIELKGDLKRALTSRSRNVSFATRTSLLIR